MKTEIINNKIIITLDIQTPEISKSGKTLTVATTQGFKKTELKIDGKNVSVSVNAYIPIR